MKKAAQASRVQQQVQARQAAAARTVKSTLPPGIAKKAVKQVAGTASAAKSKVLKPVAKAVLKTPGKSGKVPPGQAGQAGQAKKAAKVLTGRG